MKALLDEHLSAEIAEILRSRGLDVIALTERPDWVGVRDPEVVALAGAELRAVVTNNIADFRPLAAAALSAGSGHAGMVFLASRYRRTRADSGRIADALEALMRAHPDGIANQERWLSLA